MSGSQRVHVATDLPAHRAAAAQLPMTTLSGAPLRVAVIPGVARWWQDLLDARNSGAAAAVVVDPLNVAPEAMDALAASVGIPVIVERPRLRPDVALDALASRSGGPATLISVECAAAASCLEAVVRDGIGWARILGGGPAAAPGLKAAAVTAQGRMAMLDTGGPEATVPATVLATIQPGRRPGALLKVLALGTTRTEITVDQPAGITRLETATAAGTLASPERYEASARLALRRAVEACNGGADVTDLQELLLDGRCARDILGT